MNAIVISFANGGFVLQTITEDTDKTEVFMSVGKLNKAVRTAVDELSLLPKKSAEADAE